MTDTVASEDLPTANEYIALRAMMGWGAISQETARRTLQATTFAVCLRLRRAELSSQQISQSTFLRSLGRCDQMQYS